MIDKNKATETSTSFGDERDEALRLHSRKTELLEKRIASLLTQVDQEAEQFRQKISGLLTQIEALHQDSTNQAASASLVLQLREANQNLVIAALGAQDMQAKAEATTLRQEEFLSMLAHELRNPLAPVAMAAELLGSITAAHPLLPK